MAEVRFLIMRLGSLGDIVHTLPAVAALHESFPQARLGWVVEPRWRPLLDGNPDINEIIVFDRSSWTGMASSLRRLRVARYTCAIDFQGLYKSAVLAFLSGARRRVGFHRRLARERGAAVFYTERVAPAAAHVVDQNLALAESVGARKASCRFPLRIPPEAEAHVDQVLGASKLAAGEFFVMSSGGGWRGKWWPAERYGHLHRHLAERYGWRGVVNFGAGERALAEEVVSAAGTPAPLLLELNLPQLMALLRRAKLFVGGDTGPLHLGVALGVPVVGLYGPTDPARNGPYCSADIVVRNARPEETTYARSDAYSPSMLSITVEQVVAAIERRLGLA